MIGIAILGNVLEKAGVPPLTGASRYVAMALFFGLFIASGLSAIPVIVKLVLGTQVSIRNADVLAVAATIRHEKTIIWTIWGLIIAGMTLAVPAALIGGMFGDGPPRALRRIVAGPNLGVLAVRPDMTVDDMVKQSTIKLDTKYASSAIAGGGVFDFVIPGTAIRLAGARYYFIDTYSNDATHIRSLDVGTSPEKLSVAAIDSADAALRARLTSDGWLTDGPEEHLWLKDEMVLSINRKRMDDAKPGEDSATAGEWIQHVGLWAKKEYPWIERYVFQPPRAPQ
jgi:hypothetical protein